VTDGAVDAAVAKARTALDLEASEAARTWSVHGLRSGVPGFVLVVFGPSEHASGIAAVDPASGEVLEAARLPGRQQHTLITADEAIRRAGFAPDTEARLVWAPSSASRSRFYPMWQLQSAEHEAWVDSVRGVVLQTLDATRGGGSGQV
jgi:hypothetical protein